MSEWYAKDISKKVKTGIKTKGMSGKPIATEAPYGYVKDQTNKNFWLIDEEAAAQGAETTAQRNGTTTTETAGTAWERGEGVSRNGGNRTRSG